MSTTTEKQNEIAEEIRKLTKAIRVFRDGPLSERCILILLRDITGLSLSDIKNVLDGIDSLEDHFLK